MDIQNNEGCRNRAGVPGRRKPAQCSPLQLPKFQAAQHPELKLFVHTNSNGPSGILLGGKKRGVLPAC